MVKNKQFSVSDAHSFNGDLVLAETLYTVLVFSLVMKTSFGKS
jgi:hypothetical protein